MLVGMLMLAGCTYPSAGRNSVDFSGSVERTDGQFRMAGELRIDGTNSRDMDGVTVVLYGKNQSVLQKVPIGSLSSHSEGKYPTALSVNITTEQAPTYVIIESPTINSGEVPSEAFYWDGDRYTEYRAFNGGARFPSEEK